MARKGGSGGLAVAARLATSTSAPVRCHAPERRQVRINGAPASVNSLCEWLSILWLTPAMDRLFTGSAGERRRFLDRLVLALEPGHAHHAPATKRRCARATSCWRRQLGRRVARLARSGDGRAWHGDREARARTVAALDERLARRPTTNSRARRSRSRAGTAATCRDARVNRSRDAAAGRTTEGPHRQDLAVTHRAKQMPAARSSTGEQKALLLGLVLAHADLVADRRGEPPILLLDEVAAHLDPKRRAALFARLEGRGQVWMTATEAALFDGIGRRLAASTSRPGAIDPAPRWTF